MCVQGEVIGMTPRLDPWTRNGRRGEAGARGEEIQAWLERYQACHGAIADGLDAFADRHIQPTFEEGLTAAQATHAIARLGRKAQ
jgi:hypothetical protein